MTIAIVAKAVDDIFICVSDKMVSFGDISQADENATIKSPSLGPNWGVAYSASDLNLVYPILDSIRLKMAGSAYWEIAQVQSFCATAYVEKFHQEFIAKRLCRYGYTTIEQFRKEGRADLGDQFYELCRDLEKFDLGVQFLVYGYDSNKAPTIFEVSNPGYITDHDVLDYAVIGSGYYMATASLRRRPLKYHLESTIYRLLEAKFSAETASGVGKATTLLLMSSGGALSLVDDPSVERIRRIWSSAVNAPDPEDALDIIANLNGVRNVSDGGER
ncbi:MAG: hypothetical protein K2Y27_32440 [Xanthobacteraceae bacterium]|nr:hypothetical protein [Xanthobacteraceae bacterium]